MKLSFPAFAALALLAVSLTSARDARACSCVPPPPPGVALERSAAVFVADVVSVSPKSDRDKEVVLDVKRSFKGEKQGRVTLLTPTSSAACGRHFEPGKSYLVYAEELDGTLRDNLCTRTASLDRAQDDVTALEALSRGDTPQEPKPAVEGGGETPPSGAPGDEMPQLDEAPAAPAPTTSPPVGLEPPPREPEAVKSGGNCSLTGGPTSVVLSWLALLSLLAAGPMRGQSRRRTTSSRCARRRRASPP